MAGKIEKRRWLRGGEGEREGGEEKRGWKGVGKEGGAGTKEEVRKGVGTRD